MTRKYLVIFLGYAVVLVLRSVVADECPQDISNENCSLTTHNNEIEALSVSHTQEITTHTSELTTTITSLNTLTEDSEENTLRPLIFTNTLPSSTSSTTNSPSSYSTENATSSSSEISTSGPVEYATLTPTENSANEMEISTVILPEASSEASTSNETEKSALNSTDTETSTSKLLESSTLNSSESSVLNSLEMSTSNSLETSILNSSETSTSISLDNTTSNLLETSTLPDISVANLSEVSTLVTSENPAINLSDISIIKSSETSTSNSSDTSTSNSIETSTLNAPGATTSNLLLVASSLDSLETSTSNLSETSTSTFMELPNVNSSETSTSNVMIESPNVNSSETSTSTSMESPIKNSSETLTFSLMESPNSNSSEMSTSTTMETPLVNISEPSTSNFIETSTTHHLHASTSNFIENSTKTAMDNLVHSMSDHSKEASVDISTTENLPETTETPTEHAMNDETTTLMTTNMVDEPKGRALNFSVEEESPSNVLSHVSNHHDDDDAEMRSVHDDEDNYNIDVDSLDPKILAPKNQIHNSSHNVCEKGGLTYENGDKLEVGCESICTCRDGKMDCTDRCVGPYFRRGKKIDDPLCSAKEVEDPCCSILVCAGDTETEPLEICTYENKTYNRGDTFDKGCTEICTCEVAGKISCKPRCPPVTKTSDRCVEVPDPNDFCCFKVLCDVTLDEHDTEKEEEKVRVKLLSAKYVNSTAILLTFDPNTKSDDNDLIIEVSNDKISWDYYRPLPGGIVFVKERIKYLKLENTNDIVEVENGELGPPIDTEYHSHSESDLALQSDTGHGLQENGHSFPSSTEQIDTLSNCHYNDKIFKNGEEYNDDCVSLCVCQKGEMKCLKLECPTYFGLDVLDPSCIKWETVPPDFIPSAPNCCPEKVHCVDNGSCEYEGATYKNWEEIPSSITGCDQKCYCEMGNVECQNICPPVTALPPSTLDCPPHQATVSHIPSDDCCMYWVCNNDTHSSGNDGHNKLPEPFPGQHPQEDIIIQSLEPVDAHKISMSFVVPPIIVGLHGRFEVRYTHNKEEKDLDSWMLTVFAPPNDLIATPSLQFDLTDLKPDTEYSIKIIATLRDAVTMPSSKVFKVRTLKEVPPPIIPINPDLAITDINATWVTVVWRAFTQYELQFIDGIQLRYKEIDGKIYEATPLIHRAVTRYTLEKLKPNTKYEIGIYFIPFPGQMTELNAENILHFTTANEIDTYGFNVTLEISQIKSQSVEISWNGVPYPEDKYVNIYRAIYQSDSGKEDHSTFKIAKRDSPTRTIIKDLKPGTRYRLWLEVYLTNGKTKTSNVEDFITKPRVAPALGSSTQQDKLSRAEVLETKGDYYGPLVIVAILAAIAILSTLILLLILVRRHNQNKAAITPPSTRISQSAYDNPTYKVEIQQETMGL